MLTALARILKNLRFLLGLTLDQPRLIPVRVVASPLRNPGAQSSRRAWIFLGFACLASSAFATPAQAQGRIRDFTEPVLVHNSEGHHAPVRSLLFAKPDGSVLLSGGVDKVIHEWNLLGLSESPARTLRPPIWRGKRGEIRSMALAPTPDNQGQRILAVAGNGIAYNYADIVLFRYPGLDLAGQKTGDLIAHLPVAEINAPDAGHRDTILKLAFNAEGTQLASGSLDGTVRIWDVARKVPVATLAGHSGGVYGVEWITPNQVVTGDAGGFVRVWEVAPAPRELVRVNIAFDQAPIRDRHSVKAMAITLDRKFLAVGDGNGRVTRLDLPGLDNPLQFIPRADQGAVLALAISRAGTRIASSHAWANADRQGSPDFTNRESSIELRSFPAGESMARLALLEESITAIEFSPDNKSLVYAGGASNAIQIRSLNPIVANDTPRILRGHGSSIREIGFAGEGLGIAVSRTRVTGPVAPDAEWEGFDLSEGRAQHYAVGSLARPVRALAGWTVEQLGPTQTKVSHTNGFTQTVSLNAAVEGNIWCSTLLPPRAEGEHPLLAVGCTAGIAVYKIDPELRRTRFFAGHEGEVLAIAASKDAKWLATGSNDQTARLWSLADVDKLPGIGAKLEKQANGDFVFQNVERGGFIDGMGIADGDLAREALIDGTRVDLSELIARADAAIPGPDRNIMISVLKPGPGTVEERTLRVATSKRNSPTLSLFLADRPAGEWVIWTPSGLYDSSIGGDGKYLGWHLNQSAKLEIPKPTLHFPVARFRDRFLQPELIRGLLASGDEQAFQRQATQLAVAEPALIVLANRPPQLGATITKVNENLGRLRLQATSLSGAFIREIKLMSGGRSIRTIPTQANPARVEQEIDLALDPGSQRVGVVVTDDQGRVETQWIEVDSASPARPSKLWIVSAGTERIGVAPVTIPHAERDAQDLAGFLADRLVAPATGERFAANQVEKRVLTGSQASTVELSRELDELRSRLARKELAAGDLVLVACETQIFAVDKQVLLAGADLAGISPPQPAISGKDFSQKLGELTASGVSVILLLDLIHKDTTALESRGASDWIRDLRDNRGVTVFVASEPRRPSEPRLVAGRVSFPSLQHRLFAQGILNSTQAGAGRKVRVDVAGRLSIDGFQLTVNEVVRELTRGRQLTGCYTPDSVSPNLPLLNTSAR